MNELQKLFNKSVAGLASQGFKQSISRLGTCKYLNTEGLKCSVGHLMPNLTSKNDFESYRVQYLLFSKILEPSYFGVSNGFPVNELSRFLGRLQHAHDSSPSRGEMVEKLKLLAVAEGLEIPLELL
jgi:hypothetical protein